jgi:hypothetical protein
MKCPLAFTSVHGNILTGWKNPAVAAWKISFITAANDGHEKWRAKAIFAIFLLARA